MFNGKTGVAFLDGKPHGASHDQLGAELAFQTRDALTDIELECALKVRRPLGLRAKIANAEKIVTDPPAGVVGGIRRDDFAVSNSDSIIISQKRLLIPVCRQNRLPDADKPRFR